MKLGGCLCVAAILALAGCATAPTREAMSVGAPAAQTYPYSVSVLTRGGGETNQMTGANVSNEDLKDAIERSIMQSKLFRSVVQGKGAYELSVMISSLSKPSFGTSFTVELEAGWALTRASDQTPVMRKAIRSSNTATMDDAVVGAARMRLAIEGVVRKNIAQGLQAIAALGSLDGGARAEPEPAATATSRAAPYPRSLAGEEIAAHFARYASIEARQGRGAQFTLLIHADGTIERACIGCTRTSGGGSMRVSHDDGTVCFDWRVGYPASGCFRLLQKSETDFELRSVSGKPIVIRYSVGP